MYTCASYVTAPMTYLLFVSVALVAVLVAPVTRRLLLECVETHNLATLSCTSMFYPSPVFCAFRCRSQIMCNHVLFSLSPWISVQSFISLVLDLGFNASI